MMNRQLNDELLSAFLDGEVTAEERLQIEAQLAASPDWQRRYRQLVETVNLVRTLPPAPLQKDFSQTILAEVRRRQGTPPVHTSPAYPVPANATVRDKMVAPAERSTAERLRQRQKSTSPLWYLIAASVVLVLGIGVVYQTALFSPNQMEVADHGTGQPEPDSNRPESAPPHPTDIANIRVPQSENVGPGADAEIRPAPQGNDSRFPTVEELAQDQAGDPPLSMEANEPAAPPIGFNIRVRRKPGTMADGNQPAEGKEAVRPGVLARSSFQLDRQDDLGFDQVELPQLTDPEVVAEFSAWLDTNDDQRISDLEAQQVWTRFIQPSPDAGVLSDKALAAVDQDDNEKLTPAELHAAVASLRWNTGETGQNLRKFWHRLDANGDLLWSSADFSANSQFAGARTAVLDENLAQWHALLDRSHNGKVTALEFALSADLALQNLKVWEQTILHAPSLQKTRALLKTYDRDSDGQLSGRELRRFQQEETTLVERLGEIPTGGLASYELYLAVEAAELQ